MNKRVKTLQQVLSVVPQEYLVSPAVELGSGRGILSIACKTICSDIDITAIDKNVSHFNPRTIKQYKKYGIKLKEADILTVDIPPEAYATALMYQFLHHLTDCEQVKLFLNIHRILKNKGILIIIESLLPVYKKSQKNFIRLVEIEFHIDTLLNKKPERHLEYNKVLEYIHKSGFLIKQSKRFLTLHNKISRSEWRTWRQHLITQLQLIPKELQKEANELFTNFKILEKEIMREGIEEIPLTLIVCQKINFDNIFPITVEGIVIRQENDNTYLLLNKFANYMLVVNKTTLFIYGLCNGKNNINGIVEEIIKKTKGDRFKVYEDTKATLSILAEAGFIKFLDECRS